MTDATATILAALIGFVGGLVVAAYTFQQKADELFLAGLQYLGGGSQKRNLGIAALQLSWTSRRHRKVIAPLLVGVATYLLLESKQEDAAHEKENLRKIMELLTSHQGIQSLSDKDKAILKIALTRKKTYATVAPGLYLTESQVSEWIGLISK